MYIITSSPIIEEIDNLSKHILKNLTKISRCSNCLVSVLCASLPRTPTAPRFSSNNPISYYTGVDLIWVRNIYLLSQFLGTTLRGDLSTSASVQTENNRNLVKSIVKTWSSW